MNRCVICDCDSLFLTYALAKFGVGLRSGCCRFVRPLVGPVRSFAGSLARSFARSLAGSSAYFYAYFYASSYARSLAGSLTGSFCEFLQLSTRFLNCRNFAIIIHVLLLRTRAPGPTQRRTRQPGGWLVPSSVVKDHHYGRC